MKWVRERDLLIAQTMAFVQSVSRRKAAVAVAPEAKIPIELQLEATVEEAIAVEPLGEDRILELPRMTALHTSDIRQEIQNRIALFRTHQQRFHQERDQFFVSTMAQLRAPKNGHAGPLIQN